MTFKRDNDDSDLMQDLPDEQLEGLQHSMDDGDEEEEETAV